GLPAGVSCSFSPASLTIPPLDPGSTSAQPVQGTLTVTANGSIASVEPHDLFRNGGPLAAGFLLGPAGIGGLFLLIGRCRSSGSIRSQSGLAFAILFCLLGVLTACGGGSGSKGNQAAAGTTVIQITGIGSASPGASDLNQSVSLSLIVQ